MTPWAVACQAPLSIGFPKQEYWSGLPFPSSGDLPNPGIKPRSPALQAGSLLSEPPGKPVYVFIDILNTPLFLLLLSLCLSLPLTLSPSHPSPFFLASLPSSPALLCVTKTWNLSIREQSPLFYAVTKNIKLKSLRKSTFQFHFVA